MSESGRTISFGDEENPRNFVISNPGQVDLSMTNPLLWSQIESLRNTRGLFNQTLQQVMDPGRYSMLRDEYGQRAETATMNRYARMGLGGSSVAMGAADEAYRQTDLSFRDRQLNEQLKAMQADAMLNGNITKDILIGQSQYAGYENSIKNSMLQMQQLDNQKEANEMALWGSILGAAGTIGGAIAGGPSGAAAGGSIGGMAGKSQLNGFQYDPGTYSPSAYQSPNFGMIYGND